MSATLIDGKAVAARLRAQIADEVGRLRAEHHLQPGLAVVLVGSNPASEVYVRNKARQTREAGMQSFELRLPTDTPQSTLLSHVERLNADPAVNGILVQLTLPAQIDEAAIIAAVDPAKDVDGFHPVNAGRLATGGGGIVPCTPLGCLLLLKSQLKDLGGRRATIVGRSNIVGKPMAQLLLRENCTVTIAHSRTRDLPDECRRADVLVAAVGRPRMIQGSWIQPGATVIDVGINRIMTADGDTHRERLVGDVDFDAALDVAGAITPVPGGVGPMTIACLLLNTVVAACSQQALPSLLSKSV